MTIYKRGKYFQYRFTLDGKRYRGSTKTSCRQQAEIFEARQRDRAYQSLISDAGDRTIMTCRAAFDKYLNTKGERLSSRHAVASALDRACSYFGDDRHLHTITSNDIANWCKHLRDYGVRKWISDPVSNKRVVGDRIGDMSDSTVNRHLAYLRAAVNYADTAWDVHVPDITKAIKVQTTKEPPSRKRFLTSTEAWALVDQLADHLVGPVTFSLMTGMRQANCLNLDWSQVNFDARQIIIVLKGGEEQVVPMSQPVVDLLIEIGPRKEGFVFLRDGQPISSPRTAFRAACRRAGIEDFTWHDLRHTFATWMVQRTGRINLVQKALGHKHITTTMRYAHHDQQDLVDAFGKVADGITL